MKKVSVLATIIILFFAGQANALCSSYSGIANGTTADATVVMANFNCAALTSGATMELLTLNGHLNVFSDGSVSAVMTPAAWNFRSSNSNNITAMVVEQNRYNQVAFVIANTTTGAVANLMEAKDYTGVSVYYLDIGGTPHTVSDERLKKQVSAISGSHALEGLKALKPVSYILRNGSGAPQYGFLAQQVRSVFPSLVEVAAAGPLTPGGTLALNYQGIIPLIVGAIQKQQVTLSISEERSERLSAQIKGLVAARDKNARTLQEMTRQIEILVQKVQALEARKS